MVDLCLSTVKPLGAQWKVDVFNYLQQVQSLTLL